MKAAWLMAGALLFLSELAAAKTEQACQDEACFERQIRQLPEFQQCRAVFADLIAIEATDGCLKDDLAQGFTASELAQSRAAYQRLETQSRACKDTLNVGALVAYEDAKKAFQARHPEWRLAENERPAPVLCRAAPTPIKQILKKY